MAGSLSGVGAQQQFPLSQPFQPGGSDQSRTIRQTEQEQRGNDVQVRGAPTAQTESTNLTAQDRSREVSSSTGSAESEQSTARRGSLVNLVV